MSLKFIVTFVAVQSAISAHLGVTTQAQGYLLEVKQQIINQWQWHARSGRGTEN